VTITQVGTGTQVASEVGVTPTGATTNDVLLASVYWGDHLGGTQTPPSGWTLVPSSRIDHTSLGNADISGACYYIVLTGTPASTYTWTSLGGGTNVYMTAWRGCNTGAPIDTGAGAATTGETTSGAHTTIPIGGQTPSTANSVQVSFWCGDDTPLSSQPSGMTLCDSTVTNNQRAAFATVSSATGTQTWTMTGPDDAIGMNVMLVPSGGSTIDADAGTDTPAVSDTTSVGYDILRIAGVKTFLSND
jgi:hypothetical protein